MIWWVLEVEVEFKEEKGVTGDLVGVGGRVGVQGGRTGRFESVGGRGGVQEGRGGRTGHFDCVEVEVEFKEDGEEEQVIWWVLEVEVEFKEEEEV